MIKELNKNIENYNFLIERLNEVYKRKNEIIENGIVKNDLMLFGTSWYFCKIYNLSNYIISNILLHYFELRLDELNNLNNTKILINELNYQVKTLNFIRNITKRNEDLNNWLKIKNLVEKFENKDKIILNNYYNYISNLIIDNFDFMFKDSIYIFENFLNHIENVNKEIDKIKN